MKTIFFIILINFLGSVLLAQKDTGTVIFKVRKPAPGQVVIQNQDGFGFTMVDIPATFDRGDLYTFNVWVMTNIKYPQLAIENGIEGTVRVSFVVNEKGKVKDVTVIKSADPSLDQEALRVIRSSPEWTVPLVKGKPARQLFYMPVKFKLQG